MKKILTVIMALTMLAASAFTSNAELTEYEDSAPIEEMAFEVADIEVADISETIIEVFEVAEVETVSDYDGDEESSDDHVVGSGMENEAETAAKEETAIKQQKEQEKAVEATSENAQIVGSMVILPTPQKEGFTFIEWNESRDGLGASYKGGESIPFDQLNFLYAIWEQEEPAKEEAPETEAQNDILFELDPAGIQVTVEFEGTVSLTEEIKEETEPVEEMNEIPEEKEESNGQ